MATKTLSVIIPAYNERENIHSCIESIRRNTSSLEVQIIVVDGGSSDGTDLEIKRISGVDLVLAPLGRGLQVEKGLQIATGDIVLILHADSRLLNHSLERMMDLLRQWPNVIGGCFGAVYEESHFKFKVIESLNNFRARNLGIAFGDQGQFFRLSLMKNRYPAFRLMEDIELSMRLKEVGPTCFIPKGIKSSTRRWKNRGFFQNTFKVIWLTALYLARRRLGLDDGDGSRYHQKYYGNANK